IMEAVDRVLASGQWILGSEVKALEAELSPLCGGAEAIGCASGTDAIYLALKALEIGPGDDVVIPTFTFFATAGAVVRTGARPVFADVSPETFNLTAESTRAALTPKTRAVVVVHLFGQCADMDEIAGAAGPEVKLVEDAAQSIGARWNGTPAGSLGELATFSFYPSKNLGGCGDGGLVTTRNEELAVRVRRLRVHGAHPKYIHHVVGTNSRLDGVQAAILRVKLKHLSRWVERRQQWARAYTEGLQDLPWLETPVILPAAHCVWNQYTIRVTSGSRDALKQHLADAGISSVIYYPMPLHLQPCFADLGGKEGDLPVSEELSRQALSLPVDPEMTEPQHARIVETVRAWRP
ncbi:MAG: transcriptional regulator, partial [Candidatus Eisenbacteria bacterium]|nr:transcriptional regulator [Candidatus Eisenbacteria bacterium]